MEKAQHLGGAVVEATAKLFLAEGALVPGGRRLRVIAECQHEPSEFRVFCADPLFTVGMPPLKLTPSRETRAATLDRLDIVDLLDGDERFIRILHRHGFCSECGSAVQTAHGLGSALIDGLDPRGEYALAHATFTRVTELHAFLVGRRGHVPTVAMIGSRRG